ncbi:sigma-54 dependent transcriptional regulator [Sandaracinobacter sp. RS1-74]|uniref:sigma-54 interaction domain-containing protein n=1 Tax=Sandaracinobacteroides sayramensis TaxID=2913411 RepID=UPI001EDB6BB6|nr:sigma-54 dependent transcriptional regulator [Sandaracinobacteroides sayramensis]MCG2841595.1 sigma-54 dependent transcriptional regulator [Sandaracinobacteroides sayramensis]
MGEIPLQPGRARQRVSADLIGTSPAMCQLRETIARVASAEATVLITGPSGTGKENAARALHAASSRAGGPFEAVNCGAIPHELAEAELFGAEAGAYTGASKARIGRLEAANGGTLFLDEIGDLPLPLQVKLLRVLESREVQRLGASRPVPVDFRLVAATNVDLEQAVAEGRFRADLYWRLAVVWLDLPPLAARVGDIPALITHFAAVSRQRLLLSECGLAMLTAHDWPGNLRELRNLVERALALGEHALNAEAVTRLLHPRRRLMPQWLTGQGATPTPRPADLAARLQADSLGLKPMALKSLLAEAEATLIAQALAASNGTIAESARLLGLNRTTLVEKMKRMGLKAANEAA